MELAERILDFLVECGGAYTKITQEMEFSVYYCLGSRQYILKEANGVIEYFACYWKVKPEDVESIKQRIKPKDFSSGSVMYVAEAASRNGLNELVKELRQTKGIKGVFWHRPTKQDKTFDFPSQHSAR